ncbi:MAG TPA: hypothetical protein DEV93_01810 [Chloroflexi bacterium]|nr:hypothetical protein [Chloroflexota bacterium]
MSEVVISGTALAAIVEHCCARYPEEVCGFVAAHDGQLMRSIPVPNVAVPAPGTCGFLMDSMAQLRAQREMDEAGLELGGIYHSHPHSPASPSEGDVRLAAYSEAAYLIVSLVDPAHPDVRAWRIERGVAVELPVLVAPDNE